MDRALIGNIYRNLMRSIFSFGTAVFSLMHCASVAATPVYVAEDLGKLGEASEGYAINSSGQVVGITVPYGTVTYTEHATSWTGSIATDLGTLGGTNSAAFAVNASGKVVGRSDTNGDVAVHATLWSGSTKTDLGTLGGTESAANAINASGQMAGYSYIKGDEAAHATLWNGSTLVDLGTLDPTDSFVGSSAYGINASGHVVGTSGTPHGAVVATEWYGTTATALGSLWKYGYSEADVINTSGEAVGYSSTPEEDLTHATLWNGTVMTDLGTLGGNQSKATSINDSGDIVGWSLTAGGLQDATLWSGGKIYDLNLLLDSASKKAGWRLTKAWDINGDGSISGTALTPSGGEEAVRLFLSVPEPSSLALVGLAFSGLLRACRSKKRRQA